MMPVRPVGAALRADIAHPAAPLPFRLARNPHRPDCWQVVPDTGADESDCLSIGRW